MVVDAGGGTIDISAYQQKDNVFEEISAAECETLSSMPFV